jgi:hypothetical protein
MASNPAESRRRDLSHDAGDSRDTPNLIVPQKGNGFWSGEFLHDHLPSIGMIRFVVSDKLSKLIPQPLVFDLGK